MDEPSNCQIMVSTLVMTHQNQWLRCITAFLGLPVRKERSVQTHKYVCILLGHLLTLARVFGSALPSNSTEDDNAVTELHSVRHPRSHGAIVLFVETKVTPMPQLVGSRMFRGRNHVQRNGSFQTYCCAGLERVRQVGIRGGGE